MPFLKTSIAAIITAFCFIANCSRAQDHKAALVQTVDSILNSQVNADKIPGAVVKVKIGDEVIIEKAYGYAQKYDYGHHLLVKPDMMTIGTMFDIASLT